MAFASMFLIFLFIVLIIVLGSTLLSVALFIIAHILKKRELQNPEIYPNTGKKNHRILKGCAFAGLLPLTLCVGLIIFCIISSWIYNSTSLSHNMQQFNFEKAERILKRGASPDCTLGSNEKAEDGEKTLLYLLASNDFFDNTHGYDIDDDDGTNSVEYRHEKSLEFMQLLIDNGADVNYIAYRHEKDYEDHFYSDEYSIYNSSCRCGWTPLMAATCCGDFDAVKLLVENGADVNAVDFCGYNVIDILADNLNDDEGYEMLNYYLEKGVDPTHITNFQQNACWLAFRQRTGSTPFENDKIYNKLFTFEEMSTLEEIGD